MNRIKKIGMILSFLLMITAGSLNASGIGLVIGGDNLGSHTAAQDLDMAGHDINDIGNIEVTGDANVTGHGVFGSSVTVSSHVAITGDVAISGVVYSTSVYSQNSDKLDGHDSTYFAIDADLDTEISNRISEDNLISDATGQIRTDFEAYDSTLNTSTTTLRTDLGTAESAITDLETSTSTLEGRIDTTETAITNLETSTSTIEGNLNTEISNRISEDNLISDATGQIRTDFEAYDSTLNTSTGTLRTDLGTAESAITDLETSTSTLEGRIDTTESDITNLETSTSTLEGRIDTTETDITNLETSTSTLEGYVYDLWDSTDTLETAVALNTTHSGSDGSDHSFINQDVTTAGTPTFSSGTITNNFKITGDLTVGGTFYSNNSYAHGYATDVAVNVTGSTDTFTILNPTWISLVTPNGFTISGASCTYNGTGGTPKIFKVSGAFSAISDTVNTTTYWAIFKNGELYPASIINRKIAVAADVGAMGISTLISLVTGDILDVRLSGNETATITNNFVQFDIIQVN